LRVACGLATPRWIADLRFQRAVAGVLRLIAFWRTLGLVCEQGLYVYDLAGRRLIRSFSLREPGNLKGCRFFDLQSNLDYLERCEKREKAESADGDPVIPATTPTLKGQTVYAANALTGSGNEYLIGIFAGESDAWLAAQRELNQGRKVWIEPQVIG
jgi:hypothetical protein